MNSRQMAGRSTYVVATAIGCLVVWIVIRAVYETEKLKGPCKEAFGFVEKIYGPSSRGFKKAVISYSVRGEHYEYYSTGDYSFMKLGDTVLIEYSLEDPSVAIVYEKYYMAKYRELNPYK